MPGVASIDTIQHNHSDVAKSGPAKDDRGMVALPSSVGRGKYDQNVMRLDIEEAVRMAKFDLIVNAIVNLQRETTDLFVGDPIEAHIAGVKVAAEVYATEAAMEKDIVVANSFSKANEAGIAVLLAVLSLKKSGGDLVLICNAPDGQVTHYLRRSFGKTIGGRLWAPRRELPPMVKRFFVLSEYPDYAGWEWYAPPDKIIWRKRWEEILEDLREAHGEKAAVSVFPDATIQYFKLS
jgi:nickel-dependent lactate racemase